MILGDESFSTEAYLNGEYQGKGYPGWSPIATEAGLEEASNNLISLIGGIYYTNSRIYSGRSFTKGLVTQPDEDVFFLGNASYLSDSPDKHGISIVMATMNVPIMMPII